MIYEHLNLDKLLEYASKCFAVPLPYPMEGYEMDDIKVGKGWQIWKIFKGT